MQGLVTSWEGLLRATGGALVPDKYFWYLIDFEQRQGRWHYCSEDDIPGSLFVHDHQGQCTVIPRLEPSEARWTLGVCIAPNGNMHTELQYLVSVAMEWHNKMSHSRLSQYDATFSLHQVIFRKLNYPLLATTFTPDQAKCIMAPILRQGLPCARII